MSVTKEINNAWFGKARMLLVCKFLLALSIIDTESRLPFLDGMLKKLFTIVYNYIDTKCFTTIEVACYG